MLLPAGDDTIVEDGKLLDHVLNSEHPIGRNHARLFERLLGITRANYQLLKEQLLRAAVSVDVAAGRTSPFGQEFEMRVAVSGPTGRRLLVGVGSAAWWQRNHDVKRSVHQGDENS